MAYTWRYLHERGYEPHGAPIAGKRRERECETL